MDLGFIDPTFLVSFKPNILMKLASAFCSKTSEIVLRTPAISSLLPSLLYIERAFFKYSLLL